MTQSSPVLRFAPSPTGYLHIGGARTALFNWLYARHTGGQFRLRIEDTDRVRSTPEAIAAILAGLEWLGLDWDGETVYQFDRAERHRDIALELLARGHAYRCFATPEELDAMRVAQRAAGKPIRYDGRWRDREPGAAEAGKPFVVRLKARNDGETVVRDAIQGDVRFANEQLDDMILLRSDGTPTYMLAVVVDDFDMGISHVIRGDDHLNNAARQLQIIEAMGWPVPIYGHLPLIHGHDGAKLSKRHGALAVEAWRDMGYLPEAMRNYLLRLGWSHGDDEIIPTAQAIAWFNLENIGRSPARFDTKKLDSINAHYMRDMENADLARLTGELYQRLRGQPLDSRAMGRLEALMGGLKERAKTLVELLDAAEFLYREGPQALDAAAEKLLTPEGRSVLAALAPRLEQSPWESAALEQTVRDFAESQQLKLGKVAQPLRAALTGKAASPPIFDVLVVLGREESLSRLWAYMPGN